jgi:hypothetical protein
MSNELVKDLEFLFSFPYGDINSQKKHIDHAYIIPKNIGNPSALSSIKCFILNIKRELRLRSACYFTEESILHTLPTMRFTIDVFMRENFSLGDIREHQERFCILICLLDNLCTLIRRYPLITWTYQEKYQITIDICNSVSSCLQIHRVKENNYEYVQLLNMTDCILNLIITMGHVDLDNIKEGLTHFVRAKILFDPFADPNITLSWPYVNEPRSSMNVHYVKGVLYHTFAVMKLLYLKEINVYAQTIIQPELNRMKLDKEYIDNFMFFLLLGWSNLLEKLIDIVKLSGNVDLIIRIYQIIGEVTFWSDKRQLSDVYFKLSLDLSREYQIRTERAHILLLLGNGKYPNSDRNITVLTEAVTIFEKSKSYHVVYFAQKILAKAYFNKAKELLKEKREKKVDNAMTQTNLSCEPTPIPDMSDEDLKDVLRMINKSTDLLNSVYTEIYEKYSMFRLMYTINYLRAEILVWVADCVFITDNEQSIKVTVDAVKYLNYCIELLNFIIVSITLILKVLDMKIKILYVMYPIVTDPQIKQNFISEAEKTMNLYDDVFTSEKYKERLLMLSDEDIKKAYQTYKFHINEYNRIFLPGETEKRT